VARNQFPGPCRDCGKHVAEGDGYFHREGRPIRGRRWSVRCMDCVIAGKAASGRPLSRAQAAHATDKGATP
jgi:hypothetical protein